MLFVPPSIPFMVPEAEAAVIVMITDGPNGGDCSGFGTWDAGTKTCTLTTGISLGDNTAIEIASDGITLDGAGKTMSSNDADQNSGVRVSDKSDIVIKNITLQGFDHGIEIVGGSSNITIESSTMTSNTYGLSCVNSTNLHLSNNVLFGNVNSNANYSGCTFDTLLTDKKSYNYDETITVSGNSPDMVRVQLKIPGTGQINPGNIINTTVGNDSAGNYQQQINLSQYANQIVPAGTGDYLINICSSSCNPDNLNDIIDTITVHITVPTDATLHDTTPPVLNVPSDQNLSTDSFHNSGNGAYAGYPITTDSPTVAEYYEITDLPPAWLDDLYAYDAGTNATGSYSQPLGVSCSSAEFDFYTNGGGYLITTGSFAHYHGTAVIPIGTHTFTCTAIDYAENTATASFDVTVTADTTPPVITVPPPAAATFSTTNSTGFQGMIYDWLPGWYGGANVPDGENVITATDGLTESYIGWLPTIDSLRDGVVSGVACTPQVNSLFPVGTTTVTCTATDAAGNVGTASFDVTVICEECDTTPPVITMTGPTGLVWYAMNATGHNAHFQVLAQDVNAVTGVPFGVYRDVTCSHQDLFLFPVGTTTVTCTTTDYAGNVGTGSFVVTVILEEADSDSFVPIITFYKNQDVHNSDPTDPFADGFEHVLLANDEFVYNCDSQPNHPGSLAWTTCGRAHSASDGWNDDTGYNFSWVTRLSEPPPGFPPANVAYTTGLSSEMTSCQVGSVPLVESIGWLYHYHIHSFPVGTTTVTCSHTNYLGTVGTASFTVTVISEGSDEYESYTESLATPPVVTVLTNTGQNLADDGSEVSVVGNATGHNVWYASSIYAQDDNDVFLNVTCSQPPGFLFPVGTTTVTCTATDAAGTTGTTSFPITVSATDTTPPVITIPELTTAQWEFGEIGVIELTMSGSTAPTATWSVSATDNVGVTNGPACWNDDEVDAIYGQNTMAAIWNSTTQSHDFTIIDTPSGTAFPMGTSYMKCVALDAAGNVGIIYWHVIVTEATEEEEIVIPSWIKNNAGWWASNQIDDRSFVSGLQWLITNGVMHIPPTEQGAGSDDVIPSWIKNNAGWWADGLIDDRNFVTGLQWLITNGIMVIG